MQQHEDNQPVTKKELTEILTNFVGVDGGDLVFFIKGQAEIILQLNEEAIHFEQTYGQSYQLFWVKISDHTFADQMKVSLKVRPHAPNMRSTLVGPLFIKRSK